MATPITREADGASALDGEWVSDNTLNENARLKIIAEALDRTEISESLSNAILKGGVEDPDSPFFCCAYTDEKEIGVARDDRRD